MVNQSKLLTHMGRVKTSASAFFANLRALPKQGLWPFTPDPAEPGQYIFGGADPRMPLWIAGNSRHDLKRLERVLSPLGMPVLAIDTDGLDLNLAQAAGLLTVEMISSALKTAAEEETYGEIRRQILLAYPIWAALYGEASLTPTAYSRFLVPDPGPANAHDLPTFLARDRELTGAMKVRSVLLRDRLSLVFAHAGLFLLVTLLPMVLIGGWQALVLGTVMALVSALFTALLWPWLSMKRELLKAALLGLIMSVAIGAGSYLIVDLPLLGSLALAASVLLSFSWLTALIGLAYRGFGINKAISAT